MSQTKNTYLDLNQFNNIYFIGIGGIGMSALARYFKAIGKLVAGYDKTESTLTQQLVAEQIDVHYEDLNEQLPQAFKDKSTSLVIYTPAIPKDLGELQFVKENGFHLLKRSEALGLITRQSMCLGVAGTHGKTTTSCMLAHILNQTEEKCTAFLGGISTNINSNLLIHSTSPYTVVEADEFDRSFLNLHPFASIITHTDPDHLDIYGDANKFLEGFVNYAQLHPENGMIVQKQGLNLVSKAPICTYGIETEKADFNACNIDVRQGKFYFDIHTKNQKYTQFELGIAGIHNVENATACFALSCFMGVDEKIFRAALASFSGVKRRFEYIINTEKLVFIDDYAHHPTELKSLIDSVKMMYPTKHITGIFQPHLFSRTRDFMDDFAIQLSRLDELILMPIYPARELPLTGISSDVLLQKVQCEVKQVLNASQVIRYLSSKKSDVILSIGAGDIDRIVEPLKKTMYEKMA